VRRSANGDSVRAAVRELFVGECSGGRTKSTKGALVHMDSLNVLEMARGRNGDGTPKARSRHRRKRASTRKARGTRAVRKTLCEAGAMSGANGSRLFRKRRVHQYARRGYAYSWLRAYYRQVSAALESGEQSWPSLVEEMARDGVAGRNGAQLTANAALKVWRRVCRDVDAAAIGRASAAPKRKYPSRISPKWRPQVVEPPRPVASAEAWPSSPSVSQSSLGQVEDGADSGLVDFPTVDPSGAPLPEGQVFYRGQTMLRRVAEQLARIERQAREMDRFK